MKAAVAICSRHQQPSRSRLTRDRYYIPCTGAERDDLGRLLHCEQRHRRRRAGAAAPDCFERPGLCSEVPVPPGASPVLAETTPGLPRAVRVRAPARQTALVPCVLGPPGRPHCMHACLLTSTFCRPVPVFIRSLVVAHVGCSRVRRRPGGRSRAARRAGRRGGKWMSSSTKWKAVEATMCPHCSRSTYQHFHRAGAQKIRSHSTT